MAVSACGNVALRVNDVCIEIKNALLVPKLRNNLLSVSQIIANGNSVIFNANACNVYNNDLIVTANASNGTYKIENQNAACMQATAIDELMTWHRRLGHLNYDDLCKMKNGVAHGISFAENGTGIRGCEVCM